MSADRKEKLNSRSRAGFSAFAEVATKLRTRVFELSNGKYRNLRELARAMGISAKVLIEQSRREYNKVRPHSALGYQPPAPEAILTVATS